MILNNTEDNQGYYGLKNKTIKNNLFFTSCSISNFILV